MKLKVFYIGYFRQNKGYFIEILIKIKSESMSNFRVILSDPDLLNPCYDRQWHGMGTKNPEATNILPSKHKSIEIILDV